MNILKTMQGFWINDKKEFEGLVLKEIVKDYSQQRNEKVLFPFDRIFFIGNKNRA